jgi:S-adenosylmethionine decarboxylase
VNGGIEWIVDAFGCDAERLSDRGMIAELLDRVVERASLHVIATAWHRFEGPGGVTAMYLLAESHLTIHTFPESGIATLNLYCCKERVALDWRPLLDALGATNVTVRELARGHGRSVAFSGGEPPATRSGSEVDDLRVAAASGTAP